MSPFTARLEGYLGAGILDDGNRISDQHDLNGGGAGSFVGRFGPVYLQGDVTGDDVNWNPDATNIGGGGHLGLVDPNLGLIGASGSYQTLDFGSSGSSDTEFWRVGGEGEYFLGPATLGVNAGYMENTDSGSLDGYYARGLIRYYATDNLKLEGIGGVTTLDSDTVPHARALVEFKPDGLPLGLFVRWEGAFDNTVDQHFAVAGLRIYLDGLGVSERSLKDNDRIYFRDACTHTLLLTRTC